MDLVTLQEYKDYFGLSPNPTDDARIELLIDSVSALIQTYLKIDASGGQTVTENITVDYDTDKIFLNHYPVQNVTVTETGRYTTDSTVHVPLTGSVDYLVNATDGILTRVYTPGGFASWPISPAGYVTVTYTTAPRWVGGTSGVPADLKLAVLQIINYYLKEDYRQAKTIQGTSVVNTLSQGSNDFPRHIQVILDRYRDEHK